MNTKTMRGQGLHRLLAVFLCIMLCACLFPTSAFAATVRDSGEAVQTDTAEAPCGKLLIVGDASDGNVGGFAVIVESAEGTYTHTFIFEDTGLYELADLPKGEYTVSAVSNDASRGYIMPDTGEVQITDGKTEKVHFFYERYKAAGTPDKEVPQTGDGGQLVWTLLFALSLLGCGAGVVLCRMKGGKKELLPPVILLISVGLCAGSAFMLTRDAGQYTEGAEVYAEAASLAAEQTPAETENNTPEDPLAVEAAPETTAAAQEAETDPAPEREAVVQALPVLSVPLPAVDFAALREQGPDVAAWLTLPDTVINYPVAQGRDNEYYLTHLYDGTENKAGCLFLDYESAPDFSDRNTVIYGHNMRDGSMFASLLQYAGQEYYDAHPNMLLVTPEGGFLVELFTAFEASPDEAAGSASPWALDWESSKDYAAWLADMRGRSLFQSDAAAASGDKVLTLSTCTDNGSSRFIVMGRLLPVIGN